eukprot:1878651-Rhodomonas_salina.1
MDFSQVDVDRLLKGRPMDNLEFLQWLKGFYDENDRGMEYDAVERRRLCAGGQALAARGSRLSQGSRCLLLSPLSSSPSSSPPFRSPVPLSLPPHSSFPRPASLSSDRFSVCERRRR